MSEDLGRDLAYEDECYERAVHGLVCGRFDQVRRIAAEVLAEAGPLAFASLVKRLRTSVDWPLRMPGWALPGQDGVGGPQDRADRPWLASPDGLSAPEEHRFADDVCCPSTIWRGRDHAVPPGAEYLVLAAGRINDLGGVVVTLGRYAEALELSREAVSLLRRAASHSPCYEQQLAGALGDYGERLEKAGCLEEALVVTRMAMTLFRRLAEAAARG